MENIVMRYFREIYGHILAKITHNIGISARNANINNQKEHQLFAATAPRHFKWDIIGRLPHIENIFTLIPNL
jgi:hypothetical protein